MLGSDKAWQCGAGTSGERDRRAQGRLSHNVDLVG
jgi:hypothetical protein